jgi:hypothetical protein
MFEYMPSLVIKIENSYEPIFPGPALANVGPN